MTATPPGPEPAPPKRNPAPQLLLDLVENHLDPGYAAAAERRRKRGGDVRRRLDTPLAALGALVIGFLLVAAYIHTNRGAPEAQRVHDRLVERVRDAQANADDLADDLDRVESDLEREQAAALPSGGVLSRELSRAQLAAGGVAATGPGLRVTLTEPAASGSSDAPGRGGSVPIGATHILTDRDVRAVVNELWRDGAEAIAVNGVRLTPTSAIRFAGEAVLVDFQPITSPYRIEAIGDADTLATNFAQSAVAARYQTRAGALGIGFDFGNQSRLDLPAASAVSPRYATPAPSASGR